MEVRQCSQCGSIERLNGRCANCKAEFYVKSLAYLEQFDSNGIEKYLKGFKSLIDQDPDNTKGVLGLGLCYLQMGTYPLAQRQFEQVIETTPEVAPAYYYYALANIKGRRLMTLTFSEVRQVETYLNTAIQLDSEAPQYRLLLAMLKSDYYETNGMKVHPPSAAELLDDLSGKTIDHNEIKHLKKSVKVSGEEKYFEVLSNVEAA
jgi:tetratricopeptide (TPR) repeat protein